jgi:hypothetical protein
MRRTSSACWSRVAGGRGPPARCTSRDRSPAATAVCLRGAGLGKRRSPGQRTHQAAGNPARLGRALAGGGRDQRAGSLLQQDTRRTRRRRRRRRRQRRRRRWKPSWSGCWRSALSHHSHIPLPLPIQSGSPTQLPPPTQSRLVRLPPLLGADCQPAACQRREMGWGLPSSPSSLHPPSPPSPHTPPPSNDPRHMSFPSARPPRHPPTPPSSPIAFGLPLSLASPPSHEPTRT